MEHNLTTCKCWSATEHNRVTVTFNGHLVFQMCEWAWWLFTAHLCPTRRTLDFPDPVGEYLSENGITPSEPPQEWHDHLMAMGD